MRRGLSAIVAVLAGLAVAGCGQLPEAAAEDLLFFQSSGGVAIVKPGSSAPDYRASAAVPTGDWSIVVRTLPNGGTTRVVASNPSSGIELWTRTLHGNLEAKVVSPDGSLVALGPSGEQHYQFGRRYTDLVIAGDGVATPRRMRLEGNIEPEAFSTDGQSLFVIRYLPARAPGQYQVRRLDLATGAVGGVYTVDAELQEAMRGTARIQTMSPDGGRLYTLYTVGNGDARRAFVHVLSLDEEWAHCIDLPSQFAAGSESATALSVSLDGKRLYVANAAVGEVAEVDTGELRVIRTAEIGFGTVEDALAEHGPDGTLFVANGSRLSLIDTASLTEKGHWYMDTAITGIQPASDGRRVYVGLKKEVAIVDAVKGTELEKFDPEGVRRIGQFGRVMRALEEPRTSFTCGC